MVGWVNVAWWKIWGSWSLGGGKRLGGGTDGESAPDYYLKFDRNHF
jgi:hypothetical protein